MHTVDSGETAIGWYGLDMSREYSKSMVTMETKNSTSPEVAQRKCLKDPTPLIKSSLPKKLNVKLYNDRDGWRQFITDRFDAYRIRGATYILISMMSWYSICLYLGWLKRQLLLQACVYVHVFSRDWPCMMQEVRGSTHGTYIYEVAKLRLPSFRGQ